MSIPPIVGIVSLGDSVSYELVRPILESCSADHLRRLEDATPVSHSYLTVTFSLVNAVAQHLRACTNGTAHSLYERNCGTQALLDLWQGHCSREHQAETKEYSSGSLAPPKSWRVLFFVGDFCNT